MFFFFSFFVHQKEKSFRLMKLFFRSLNDCELFWAKKTEFFVCFFNKKMSEDLCKVRNCVKLVQASHFCKEHKLRHDSVQPLTLTDDWTDCSPGGLCVWSECSCDRDPTNACGFCVPNQRGPFNDGHCRGLCKRKHTHKNTTNSSSTSSSAAAAAASSFSSISASSTSTSALQQQIQQLQAQLQQSQQETSEAQTNLASACQSNQNHSKKPLHYSERRTRDHCLDLDRRNNACGRKIPHWNSPSNRPSKSLVPSMSRIFACAIHKNSSFQLAVSHNFEYRTLQAFFFKKFILFFKWDFYF